MLPFHLPPPREVDKELFQVEDHLAKSEAATDKAKRLIDHNRQEYHRMAAIPDITSEDLESIEDGILKMVDRYEGLLRDQRQLIAIREGLYRVATPGKAS